MCRLKKFFYILGVSCLLMGLPAAQAAEVVGKVIMTSGTVVAKQSNKVRVLKRGAPIYLKDTIETSDQSRAHIRFKDRTLVELDKNSIFVINQFKYNPKNARKSVQESSLIKGGFKTITGLISKQNNKNYKVNTPVATIGVRSTIYSLMIMGGSNPEHMTLWMTVFEGTACAKGLGPQPFNACFTANSPTDNARITMQGVSGMSQVDQAAMGEGGTTQSQPEGNAFDQGDVKGLNQDFINIQSNTPRGRPSSPNVIGNDNLPGQGGGGVTITIEIEPSITNVPQ